MAKKKSMYILEDKLDINGLAVEVVARSPQPQGHSIHFRAEQTWKTTGDYVIFRQGPLGRERAIDTAYTLEGVSEALYNAALKEIPEENFEYRRNGEQSGNILTKDTLGAYLLQRRLVSNAGKIIAIVAGKKRK